MRTCDACGFENAEPGKSCALCGASEIAHATADISTLVAPKTPTPGSGASAGTGALKPGDVLGGRYRVLSLLGSGGMGQVFRVARRERRHTARAQGAAPARRGRRRSRPPLPARDPGPDPHPPPGRAADPRLGSQRRGPVPRDGARGRRGPEARDPPARPVPAGEAAALGATLAEALAAAHAQGIVHRDVKPNNVMIASDGSVRLLDFGLARGAGIDMTTLTRTGTILGHARLHVAGAVRRAPGWTSAATSTRSASCSSRC